MDTSRFDQAVELFRDICLELLEEKEDFVDVETDAFKISLDVLRKALGYALTAFDDRLFKAGGLGASKSRERRRIISLCGEVSFTRRRYTQNGSTYVPLDEILALSSRSRLSPAATCEITRLALDMSYQKVADTFRRVSGVAISKPAVGEAICATASELDVASSPDKKKALTTLYCEADGIWVALQHTKKARLTAARHNQVLPRKQEVCLATDYEGKTVGSCGENTRINAHYLVSLEGHDAFWRQVEDNYQKRFDTTSINTTLFATDGESGYINGASYLPGRVIHILDRFHVFRNVRALTGPDIAPEIIALLCARKLEGALLHLGGYRNYYRTLGNYKLAKDIQKLMKYLVKWQDAILAGLIFSLGSCEGSNAHVVAARTKTCGRAWSVRRLGALVSLLAWTHSGYDLPKIRRRQIPVLKPEDPPEAPAADKQLSKPETKSSGAAYYHQVTSTDELVADIASSWQDNYRFI